MVQWGVLLLSTFRVRGSNLGPGLVWPCSHGGVGWFLPQSENTHTYEVNWGFYTAQGAQALPLPFF